MKIIMTLLVLAVICAMVPVSQAGEKLSVIVAFKTGDRYVEPIDKQVRIRTQPMRMYICVRNVSEDTQNVNAMAESAYSFELTDKDGKVTIMQPKRKMGDSRPTGTYVGIASGKEQATEIVIDREKWEGIPVVEPGKRQDFKMRAVYLNHDGRNLYSESYSLVIDVGESVEPEKKQ